MSEKSLKLIFYTKIAYFGRDREASLPQYNLLEKRSICLLVHRSILIKFSNIVMTSPSLTLKSEPKNIIICMNKNKQQSQPKRTQVIN